MAAHLFKSGYGQCQCRWCGFSKYGRYDCPVTIEMRLALATFAADNGKRWKEKLKDAWARDYDLGPEMKSLRAVMEPRRRVLAKITTPMLQYLRTAIVATGTMSTSLRT